MTQPDRKTPFAGNSGRVLSPEEREALAREYLDEGWANGKAVPRTLTATPGQRSALAARVEEAAPAEPRVAASYADDQVPPRPIARLAAPTPEQIAEREAAKERLSALRDIFRDFEKTSGVERAQAFTVYARGEVRRGKILQAMAPTRQIAEWATGRGRNRPWIRAEQLVALSLYHGLYCARMVGRAVVDMESPSVQGGGAGDTLHAIVHAADAGKRFERARAAIPSGFSRRVIDGVVLHDLPLDDISLGPEFEIKQGQYVCGARRLAFVQGAMDLARHFGR